LRSIEDSAAVIETTQSKKVPIAIVLCDFAGVRGPNSFSQRKAQPLAEGRITRRTG
jgi:hypothetical protein